MQPEKQTPPPVNDILWDLKHQRLMEDCLQDESEVARWRGFAEIAIDGSFKNAQIRGLENKANSCKGILPMQNYLFNQFSKLKNPWKANEEGRAWRLAMAEAISEIPEEVDRVFPMPEESHFHQTVRRQKLVIQMMRGRVAIFVAYALFLEAKSWKT